MNQLQLIFDMIEKGVEIINNSEHFIKYLKLMSLFHEYSYCNSLLIYSQCPHASYIARYKAWKTLFNRFVIKGSKAIRIITRFKVKLKRDDDTKDPDNEDTYIIRYNTVNVFDINQTEGQELPSIVSEIQAIKKTHSFF